jgi:hypothetical protein
VRGGGALIRDRAPVRPPQGRVLQLEYDVGETGSRAPTLAAFLSCSDFVRLVQGPYGSGKSSVCIVEILLRAQEQEPGAAGVRHSRFALVRNTYRELEDTTRKTFEQWVPSELCEWNEKDFVCTIRFGDVECECLFRALDRPEHIKKLKSLELTGAYLNEISELPKGVIDALTSRVGRFPSMKDGGSTWSGIWGDTNPPDDDHWLFKTFEEGDDAKGGDDETPLPTRIIENTYTLPDGTEQVVRWRLFKQPSGLSAEAENIPKLTPGYYQRQCLGKDEDWINVFVHGRYGFVKSGKPIWPQYRDDVHCRPVTPRPGAELLLGMDFGLTPAAVLGQRDPATKQLQIFDELVSEDLGAVTFARELARKIKSEYPGRPVRGFGDPAGEQRSQVDERTPFNVVQAAGLPVVPAPTNDYRLRVEAVSGLLTRLTMTATPAFVVDPRCKVLRKALASGYCRERLKVAGDERFRDAPIKNRFSHVAEALQYLCVGEGEDRAAVYGAETRRVPVNFKVKRAFGSSRR